MAPPSTNSRRVKGVSVTRPIIYGNTATPIGAIRPAGINPEHTHRWTVFVRDPNGNDISYMIKKVVFKLHDTYPNAARSIESPPFEVHETGWGEFEINIKIFFVSESGEKNISIFHHLRLHPYQNLPNGDVIAIGDSAGAATGGVSGSGGGGVSSSRSGTPDLKREDSGMMNVSKVVESITYDEIVFNEPTDKMFETLTKVIRTLLPMKSTKSNQFSRQLEQDELDRLQIAATKVAKELEQEKQKLKLLEQEKNKLVINE